MKPQIRKIHTIAILIVALYSLQFSEPCFAQKQGKARLDSLLAELEKHRVEDTTRVNLLSSISQAFSSVDPDKGIVFAQDGIRLAEKIKFRKGVGKNYASAGSCFRIKSDNKKALECYFKAIDIFEEVQYNQGKAGPLIGIGLVYFNQSNYQKALEFYLRGLKKYEESGDKKSAVSAENNIGVLYLRQANYPKALECFFRVLKATEERGDKLAMSSSYCNIGNVYANQADHRKAIDNYLKALKIAEDLGDLVIIAICTGNIGGMYCELVDYQKALEFLSKALKIQEKLGNKLGLARDMGSIANVYAHQYDFPKALEYYFKALEMNKELKSPRGIMLNLGSIGGLYLQMATDTILRNEPLNASLLRFNKTLYLKKAVEYTSKAVVIAVENHFDDDLIGYYQRLSQAHKEFGNWRNAFEFANKSQTLKDSVFSFENKKKIANLEAKRETELKEKELIIFRERDKQQKMLIWFAAGGASLLLLFSFFVWRERGKSEKLLLNILPAKIAARLKKKEKYIADHFDEASVVFFDISEFTKLTKNTKPERVVEVLNKLYTEFDHIADRHGLEKIKTIGDCYMAVAGIPEPRTDHAQAAAAFASEAMRKLNGYKTEDGTEILFKAGVDCGPVIAGVIGERKFIYDLWGDTVNTASRMEEYGEPGRIHVTGRFKEALEPPLPLDKLGIPPSGNLPLFNGETERSYNFIGRGELEVRGHGIITTWWMEK